MIYIISLEFVIRVVVPYKTLAKASDAMNDTAMRTTRIFVIILNALCWVILSCGLDAGTVVLPLSAFILRNVLFLVIV